MLEMVYAQVFLADGKVNAWSSSRGRIENVTGPLAELFGSLRPMEPSAKVMVHLIGDDELVSDDERMELMEASKQAGFTVARIEMGAPMEPDEAFTLMMLPFT